MGMPTLTDEKSLAELFEDWPTAEDGQVERLDALTDRIMNRPADAAAAPAIPILVTLLEDPSPDISSGLRGYLATALALFAELSDDGHAPRTRAALRQRAPTFLRVLDV